MEYIQKGGDAKTNKSTKTHKTKTQYELQIFTEMAQVLMRMAVTEH